MVRDFKMILPPSKKLRKKFLKFLKKEFDSAYIEDSVFWLWEERYWRIQALHSGGYYSTFYAEWIDEKWEFGFIEKLADVLFQDR